MFDALGDETAMPTHAPATLFTPVGKARVSETIAAQIRQAIREGRLQTGDRLPSERELGLRFAVSRVSVRDALRILECAGLIEVRVGARGGAIVTSPGYTEIRRFFSDILTMSTLSLEDVMETVAAFEQGIIDYICERANDGDLVDLEEICGRSELATINNADRIALFTEFHCRLASAAHNNTFVLIAETLRSVIPALTLHSATSTCTPALGGSRSRALDDHREIINAIRETDSSRIRFVMRSHSCTGVWPSGLSDLPSPFPRHKG